jgi:NH3-dependent NAD+ synthetase
MGISYDAIDTFLLDGTVTPENKVIMDRFHNRSQHKRKLPSVYRDEE